MPSSALRLFAVTLLLASSGSILWSFFDHVKSLRTRKKIFISADCWLLVFDFLSPSQLGLEIALISHRFDVYVDEHFKTRKWALTNNDLIIQWHIKKNSTKKMQIVKSDGNPLSIPKKPLPNKVIGFCGYIQIMYIDQNVLIFLSHFHPSFAATYTVYLDIITEDSRILEFVLNYIWPMFRDSIFRMFLNAITFRRMCQLAPSMLTDCPALRFVESDDAIFPEFLHDDDNAMASDGETVAKWLFTPSPDGGPKWLQCLVDLSVDQWTASMEQLRTAFSNASSPLTFFIVLKLSSTLSGSVMPFFLINEATGEQLALEQYDLDAFELLRCPIGWVWANWKKEWKELSAARPRRIDIWIRDGGFDEGLLEAASPGPSDQQQQQ